VTAGDRPELSDLIVSYDPETGARRPVRKADVLERLRGDRWAAWIASRLEADAEGVLVPEAVDDLLVRAHCELQRLNEEFQQGVRVRAFLAPLLAALRRRETPRPLRVVDLGCGIGYVVRWLALRGDLGDDVELIGCDMNAALLAVAERAARAEGLRCRFVAGNAFRLAEPAHVYVSTGVLHHFRGPELERVFAEQAPALAFAHWDIQASWMAPLGAAIFHLARMRVPLAQHDGTRSAARAHPDDRLLAAVRAALPGWRSGFFDVNRSFFPITKVMRPVVGARADLWPGVVEALGPEARRLADVA